MLGGEREAPEVGELTTVVGLQARVVERLAVVRHVVVRVPQCPPQSLELERSDLVTRGGLDRLEIGCLRGEVLHAANVTLSLSVMPPSAGGTQHRGQSGSSLDHERSAPSVGGTRQRAAW